ncbi:HEAT repeat domain-containing protein [Puniceicoccaceae bacterium K14]|nr:HEAT repeat domain-containing protein [Puniceicoccaceae bacterium K14]
MTEKEINDFMEELTTTDHYKNDDASTTQNYTEDQTKISSLWKKLGEMPKENQSNPVSVSKFQVHLDAYKRGWEAGQRENTSPKKQPSILSFFSRSSSYGLAACIAVFLFLSGMMVTRTLKSDQVLHQELAATREMLSLALINQSSAPQRVVGLTNASQIESPSEELKKAVLWALDNDTNLNVRLAAIEALGYLSPKEAAELLIQRVGEQDSPLLQMEMIRVTQLYASPDQLQSLNKTLQERTLKPSIKSYLDSDKSSI